MYHANPPRGCGSKKPNSFYAEGGEFSSDGALYPWTWLLGDGLEQNIFMSIPPRQIQLLNPILTIFFQSFMPASGPSVPIPEFRKWEYEHLKDATSTPGVGDHVGSQYYTPFSFAVETEELSASRRVSPKVAKALALAINQFGPLPFMFTHKDIPSFRSPEELQVTMNHVATCMGKNLDSLFMQPTWKHDNWGMYARRSQWIGYQHFMIPVLIFMEILKENWGEFKDDLAWIDAREYFRGLRYVEQTFGMSWLCNVTYTMPPDEAQPDKDIMKILEDTPGINVIDLDDIEEYIIDLEETNEQAK